MLQGIETRMCDLLGRLHVGSRPTAITTTPGGGGGGGGGGRDAAAAIAPVLPPDTHTSTFVNTHVSARDLAGAKGGR